MGVKMQVEEWVNMKYPGAEVLVKREGKGWCYCVARVSDNLMLIKYSKSTNIYVKSLMAINKNEAEEVVTLLSEAIRLLKVRELEELAKKVGAKIVFK